MRMIVAGVVLLALSACATVEPVTAQPETEPEPPSVSFDDVPGGVVDAAALLVNGLLIAPLW
jgi:hypothetical protein